MNLLEMLQTMIPPALFFAAPLIFTALGGVLSERSGVINIGLEGLMIMGAFVGVVFNLAFVDVFGDIWTPWVSILVAAFVSALFALLHAVASITFRADQVVSGVAINFLALGIGLFLVKQWYGKGQTDMVDAPFYTADIPVLSSIPVIGPIFFSNTYYTTWLAIVLAIVIYLIIFKTPFGLRLRSVGEHPMAADTLGINVVKMRYIAVMLSGFMGGLGGSIYALTIAMDFSHSTISGQGFMALAAMIFGKWHPLGAMGAALFFGFAQSLSVISATIPFLQDVPQVYLLIAPYVLTILALAGFIGRADAPKALGSPYIKGSR
ncbi:nucleoside ABC transporter membrane protein [Melghiribacillus thermohalophilus]|uniref:Nucleoside ABC transporter membrane protein n=1 Tax=Melghiribacillus thermohalophilus TaxID=1324956 RepID=A0A4R3NCS0_9BACI|nr:ABC transporter permease [Melghiribacillus thermohalophilus]TCT26706.1 nucleoside ABC transporter membrane protein [Melghiribacillus thermohalophilus]